MRKILFCFLTKKGQTFHLVKISFLKDIYSLDLLHFMQLWRIWQHCIVWYATEEQWF